MPVRGSRPLSLGPALVEDENPAQRDQHLLEKGYGITYKQYPASTGKFDFTSPWLLGSTSMPKTSPLPICSDELVDWASDATMLAGILRRAQQQRHFTKSELNEKITKDIDSPGTYNDADSQQTFPDPKREQPIESCDCSRSSTGQVAFLPYVLATKAFEMKHLSSKSWMDRAAYYSKSVCTPVCAAIRDSEGCDSTQ